MPDETPIAEPPPYAEDWDADPAGELPPRRPPRRLTPLHLALLAVLLGAAGFVGGVLVEKGQVPSGTSGGGGLAAAFAAARGGAQPGGAGGSGGGGFLAGGGGAGGRGTIGQVTTVDGSTLYVTTFDGSTVKVTAAPGATVTRSVAAKVRDIHPGETVVVQGATHGDAIAATSIRATPAPQGAGGGSGGGGVVNQLFGGGGPGGSGSAASPSPPGG